MADLIDPSTGTKLTPSFRGKECLGNGSWPGYECCCDECDYYLECFPDWRMGTQLEEARECVRSGWWPILDKYVPLILAIDPEAQIEVKEKFGMLRIWVGSETLEDCSVFDPFIEEAEEASKTVCEICGAPGRLRKGRWIQTLCDDCAELSK